MRVDPVIALMDEIERAYVMLADARSADDWPATRRGLARIAMLHQRLIATEPATVIGAACLLREAASLLPQSQGPSLSDSLRAIAARFDEGRRRVEDLVWLRGIAGELATGASGDLGQAAANMIRLAIKGAARPVLLFRAVSPSTSMPRVQERRPPAIPSTS